MKSLLLLALAAAAVLTSSCNTFIGLGRDMRIDFTDLTRPDPTHQYEVLNTAIKSGLLSLDEGRAHLGLPPSTKGIPQ